MKRSPKTNRLALSLGDLWVAIFLWAILFRSSDWPLGNVPWLLMAVSGGAIVSAFHFDEFAEVFRKHRALWILGWLTGALVIATETYSIFFYSHPYEWHQAWHGVMLFSLPILATLLLRARRLTWVFALFAALCAWHLVFLPVEGLTGFRLNWFGYPQLDAERLIYKIQAGGLAARTYYFPGFFVPLMYLVLGAVRWKYVRIPLFDPKPRTVLILAALWILSMTACQSRSVLIGTVIATLLMMMETQGKLRKFVLYFAGVTAVVGAGLFIFLLVGKSGMGLRWQYMMLYFKDALNWPYILTGHGQAVNNNYMWVPDTQFLAHSHNDFAQVAYWYGYVTLAAYLGFLFSLIRLIYTRFMKRGEYWPLAAFLAVFPSMMSDLGMNHHEKILFIAVLSGCLVSFAENGKLARVKAATEAVTPSRAKTAAKRGAKSRAKS